jgi:2-polyprenyl-3-methyl-5-hydroxy-6-metoxy-1,4-benzoquinol methylase
MTTPTTPISPSQTPVLSPLTGKPNVRAIARYSPCIVSDGHPTTGVADNYLCLDTGLLFNNAGTRGRETGFYQDEYELHAESVEAEFMHFDGGKGIGLYDNILQFMRDGVTLPKDGRALDIGCGKGLLLNRFERHFPAWSLAAIEPSKNAIKFFAQVMPKLRVFEGTFEASPFAQEQFDFVMANGVLEHVPYPQEFLRGFASCIREGGHGFIGVPNLATNPADLLTFDHLSKLTPNVTKDLFKSAGLRVVAEAVPSTRVPMWFIVTKDPDAANRSSHVNLDEEADIAARANDYIQKSFAACEAAAMAARKDGKALALFGTGAVAFAAADHTSMKLRDLTCIFDDNPSLWGKDKLGVPVRSSDDLRTATDVGHIIISANACYYPTILKRIEQLTAGRTPKVYLAEGHG